MNTRNFLTVLVSGIAAFVLSCSNNDPIIDPLVIDPPEGITILSKSNLSEPFELVSATYYKWEC